jgi:hypothetical protein
MPTISFPKGPLPASYFTADRSDVLLGITITFTALEVISFGLRVLARKIIGTKLTLDDILIVPALVCNLAVCAVCFAILQYGVGKHTLAVITDDPNWISSSKFKDLSILCQIALPITYLFAVTFSKLSILNLYLRIFSFEKSRYIIYTLGAVSIVHCLVCSLVIVLQCNPISDAWALDSEDRCINIAVFFWASSIPNIATDVVILVMPLPYVWKLNAPSRVKAGITITFLTASLGIISSVLGLVGFLKTDIYSDPLWHAVDTAAYTLAEPATIFLAACWVTYRPLLKHISQSSHFSRFTSKTSRNSKSYQNMGVQEHKAKPHVRGFDSILLSAISRDTKAETEPKIAHVKADGTYRENGSAV